MHSHDLSRWAHQHDYAYGHERDSERRTSIVVLLTGAMMVAEITSGWLFNSMALLADGWHMATHTVALGVGVYAYRYARLNAHNPAYSFGTGKVHALGSFTSALFLALVAAFILGDSLWTLMDPKPVRYDEALIVAVLGFIVNAISIKLLHAGGHDHHDQHGDLHGHGHDHDHGQHPHAHDHDHDHDGAHHHVRDRGRAHDHNLKAAYAHVVVDAMTSVFAIVALLVGKYLGWTAVDPIVGIVGAFVIGQWAYNLIRNATHTLLDRQPSTEVLDEIRSRIQDDGDSRIADLHVWYVAPGRLSAIVSVVAGATRSADDYRARLDDLDLAHLTIEFNQCTSH
ncbi:MAG: CDF family Co(II)/Ni(II) efflux transporter DmeF [Pseudolabrys sp.]|jgi:cation diffusion facilitator family transporter